MSIEDRVDGTLHAVSEAVPCLRSRRAMPDRALVADVLDDLGIGSDDLLEPHAFPSADVRLGELVVERDVGLRSPRERLRGLSRAPERRGVHGERIQVHHEEPLGEQVGLPGTLFGQRRIPLFASGTRPALALPAEVRLPVADQEEDAIGHAGAESDVGRFGGAGCVARQ